MPQVWAGNEACEPVTWQECELVPKNVKFIVPEINCTDGNEVGTDHLVVSHWSFLVEIFDIVFDTFFVIFVIFTSTTISILLLQIWYHEPEDVEDIRMTNTFGCEVGAGARGAGDVDVAGCSGGAVGASL